MSAEWNGAGTAFEGVPGVTDLSELEAPTIGDGLAVDKRYIYDFAGRLTRVDDRTAANTGITLDPDTGGDPQAPCVRREYSFDKNGNRTKLKTSSSDGGDCFYASLDSEVDYTYDALDRPIKAGDGTDYVYDGFGRQTLIPEADAPVDDAGDITVKYFDDDLARKITQDGITTTFELDALARRTTSTITGQATVTRHYGDDTDNPAWTTNSDGMVMRSVGSLDGLGGIVFGDGTAALTIGNPHGDNVTTVILPVGQAETTAAVSINGWSDYDEYGVTKTGDRHGVTYGWLGKHERATSIESAGLTLMGVRLYNPIRGAFTSVDPVAGGNTTAYTYPQDPINMLDLTGTVKVLRQYSVGWVWKGEVFSKKVKSYINEFGSATALGINVFYGYPAWWAYGEEIGRYVKIQWKIKAIIQLGRDKNGKMVQRVKYENWLYRRPYVKFKIYAWARKIYGNTRHALYPKWIGRKMTTSYTKWTRA